MSMLFKRIKDWATSITAFRTGDVIPVDGPSGTAKMSKDTLLELTAQNALAGNVAPEFDSTKPNDDGGYAYYAGTNVTYNGKNYVFIVNHPSGAWNPEEVEQKPLSEGINTESVGEAVANWLDNHPEATTTVQDGSLTKEKFSDTLKLQTINDYVTPEMFGAKGDGVTDDTDAIQAAINNGSRVFFANKTYGFKVLNLKSNLELFGEGELLYVETPSTPGQSYFPIKADSKSNIKIHGITINGNPANASYDDTIFSVCDMLTLLNCDNVEVYSCNFLNSCDSGIMFSECKNSQIHHCFFDKATDCGIYVNANDNEQGMSDFSIHNNIIKNIRHSGVSLKRITANGVVDNNIFDACENGITTEHASTPSDYSTKLSFCGNYIRNSTGIGILLRGGENFLCNNNRIEEFSGRAIMIDSIRKSCVNGNVLVSNVAKGYGIVVTCRDNNFPTEDVIISNNIVMTASKTALYIFHEQANKVFTKIHVIGNTLRRQDSNSSSAIVIQSGNTITDLVIENNIFTKISVPADNVDQILIRNNEISGAIDTIKPTLIDRQLSYGGKRRNIYIANSPTVTSSYTFNKEDMVYYTDNYPVVASVASATGQGSSVLKPCILYTQPSS